MKTSLRRPAANLTAMTGWLLVRWLHVISMAFFVGGQLFLAVAVVPVERRAPDRERLRAIARRFGWGSVVALVVLVITGSAMAGPGIRAPPPPPPPRVPPPRGGGGGERKGGGGGGRAAAPPHPRRAPPSAS